MLSYKFHTYLCDQKKITYVSHKLDDESKHGSVEIKTSFRVKPGIYQHILKDTTNNEELYIINDNRVFAMEDHLFKLLDNNSIEEIRNKHEFYFYAYTIALRKLEHIQIDNSALKNTINSLISEVKSANHYTYYSTLHEILSQTYHIVIERDPIKRMEALNEYQELIKSVEERKGLKKLGMIMLGLSLAVMAMSLAVVLPPLALPISIAIITTLLCTPLAIYSSLFFTTGSKYQSLAHKMQDVKTSHALIDSSMGHS
ncbi:hypothetical protein [Legionella fairfieldensis]|uniref:hypothetical protein n=1 Tax=Legionella fairfieldensis TaxID=45064 RepID=UPI000A708A54|nr:hypothetical protein [Legionella fairfieldensis]